MQGIQWNNHFHMSAQSVEGSLNIRVIWNGTCSPMKMLPTSFAGDVLQDINMILPWWITNWYVKGCHQKCGKPYWENINMFTNVIDVNTRLPLWVNSQRICDLTPVRNHINVEDAKFLSHELLIANATRVYAMAQVPRISHQNNWLTANISENDFLFANDIFRVF